MLQKHMKSERNSKQSAFEAEMNIDWNGPVVSRSEKLLKEFFGPEVWKQKTVEFQVRRDKILQL